MPSRSTLKGINTPMSTSPSFGAIAARWQLLQRCGADAAKCSSGSMDSGIHRGDDVVQCFPLCFCRTVCTIKILYLLMI